MESKSQQARPLALPIGFSLALAAFALLGPVRGSPTLLWTFLVTAGLLVGWAVVLLVASVAKGRRLSVEVVLSKQHYLQACAHAAIFLYWGWYFREVYGYAYLILAQLVFAYAFDSLLTWSRRDSYALGFGPFPIIFSTNLFLWFRTDWFYLQFLTVAVGFGAKEFFKWQKGDRRAHIFNPSSFPLALLSLVLLVTGTSGITWGREIALSQFFPPHMYLFLFAISLPGQYLFGVTSMTLAAVVTTYLFGLAYLAVTGTYFFFDSYIPIAVFLGMQLLFTDPSTSPRSELGRVIFGILYALSVIALFQILESAGLPSYADKLLVVPLLNLSIKRIDRLAASKLLRRFDPSQLGRTLTGRRRNLAYMAVWTVVFAGMSAVQGVGDDHPGQYVPFWQQACRNTGRKRACDYRDRMNNAYCAARSGWACNEAAIDELESKHDGAGALDLLLGGCADGFLPACANAQKLRAGGGMPEHAPPTVADYPVILSGSKGSRLAGLSPAELSARACSQGWTEACRAR